MNIHGYVCEKVVAAQGYFRGQQRTRLKRRLCYLIVLYHQKKFTVRYLKIKAKLNT